MTAADELLGRLDAAGSDDERAALLAGAPADLLAQVSATLTYRQFLAEPDPYADFTRALDGAASDEERLKLIAAADPAFVAEWSWRRTATADAWCRRYLAAIGCEASP